jgi:hypothetical protein
METVITRDTDIIREYLAALDARERGLSPFGRLQATVKLARLRSELDRAHLEATEEDISALRREVDERLNRTYLRRVQSRPLGARLFIFLVMVVSNQLALGLWLLATVLFVSLAPTPKWWNPVLPHEEPVFLWVFLFLFFFVTPITGLLALFGGRYFRSWRKTVPATLIIFLLAVLGTLLAVRGKTNPVQRSSSLKQLAKQRGLETDESYRQWVEANWLMKDPRFERDYEVYLRKGPGRWITSRFNANSDEAWRDALPVFNEYLDGGQDIESFREWLKYYLDRNRIYSEDRIDQEVAQMTGEANQQLLGIWQVEPYLKERDQRSYRAYLGSVNRAAKGWGFASLALLALIFLVFYFAESARFARRRSRRSRRSAQSSFDVEGEPVRTAEPVAAGNWFPEKQDITSMPFFDAPFEMMSQTHRSFVRLAVSAVLFVFGFWAVVYAADLAGGRENAPSQIAFMRSHLLFGGSAEPDETEDASLLATVSADSDQPQPATSRQQGARSREELLAARVGELERRLDEGDYESTKKFKEQTNIIASQRTEIDYLKGLSSQLQQTQAVFPNQLAEISSRASAAEARTGEVVGEIGGVRQKAEAAEQQLSKVAQVETRAARVAEQVGKVEEQASVLATRTEALEKELDRRARQIEARTEELGERTAALKEREEHFDRLQHAAFSAILSSIQAEVEDLDRLTRSTFYQFFKKEDARRNAESLKARINSLTAGMREVKSDQAKQLITQLEELQKRLEGIAARF